MALSLSEGDPRGPRRGVKGSCGTPGTPWVISPDERVEEVDVTECEIQNRGVVHVGHVHAALDDQLPARGPGAVKQRLHCLEEVVEIPRGVLPRPA
jgi:hypothetical protein